VFNQSLQNSWGDEWKWRRKALSPHFTGSKLQSAAMWQTIQEEVDRTVGELREAARTNTSVLMLDVLSNVSKFLSLCSLFHIPSLSSSL
jgi:cytochrome P450